MDDALAKEEARQLELALRASLADQGTPPPPPPKIANWGNVPGGWMSTQNQGGPSQNRTPRSTTPKGSGIVGGAEGFAFIPGFGNVLDGSSRGSPKPKSSNHENGVKEDGLGETNGVVGSRQRRPGLNEGQVGVSLNGEYQNGGLGLRNQDEEDRALALKLAAEENQKGPHKPDEEHDRLLALRLQEEEARTVEVVAHPSPIPPSPSDEELARNLQEQLDREDRQANGNAPPGTTANVSAPRGGFRLPLGGSLGAIPQIPAPLRALGQRLSNLGPASAQEICTRCRQPITGRYLKTADQIWHVACLLCNWCNQNIQGGTKVHQGNTYHEDCYWQHIHPRCSVCRMPIPVNENKVIEFYTHPFWRDKHCKAHETDGTKRCCACNRLEPVNVQYVTLDDGRKLCLECCSSVVVDTADCQPLYREVLQFYDTMGLRLRQKDIPLLLVEQQALNEAHEKEHTGGGANPGSNHPTTTRGLCLSEEQTIFSVVRKPTGRFSPYQGLSHETEQQVIRRHCDVTAILILFGLPRLLTGSILAHELMHAWLRLDGSFPHLDPEIEEGICQVLGHMWLQTHLSAHSPTEQEPTRSLEDIAGAQFRSSDGDRIKSEQEVSEKLAECFSFDIETNPTAVYGAGYRAGHAAVVKYGLEGVLEHMRMTGQFPA